MPAGTPPRRRGPALVAMLGVAVVAGIMVAVGVTPALAFTGTAAKQGIGMFEDLPSDLTIAPLDQKTEIYAKDGDEDVLLASFYAQNREVVGWDAISDVVKHAAVAGEDVRYYEHGGIDPLGILRATVANLRGSDLQGASTITQQYVKNVCVQEAENKATTKEVDAAYAVCTDPSVGRKLREARLAIALEKQYSKDAILLGYLNIAGFGGRIYGIESAAEYYFDTSAKDLTVAQAASLIAIVNNPERLRLDVAANYARNKERRDYVLGVEVRNGLITQAQYDEAVATPIEPKITQTRSGCQAAGVAGFFCDYVVRTILTDKAFGATAAIREANLQRSGWKIHTTLDLALTKKAQSSMNAWVPKSSQVFQVGGASVSVQVGTGRILSMVQNKDYNDSSADPGPDATSVNYAAGRPLSAGAGFQPGSTFKVFTLLDWLKSGRGLNEVVDSNPGTTSDFTACGKPYQGVPYTFGNDTGDEGGYQTVLNGTARSINGTFVGMAQQLDLCDIQDLAEQFGVTPVTGTAQPQSVASFIIGGAYTVSPVAIAAAYAGIANEGEYCSPIAIASVEKTDGSELDVPKTTCTQVVTPEVANAAVYALRGVFTSGTASGDRTDDGLFEFGKTGTTDNAYDTWMTGATSKVATTVWVGNVQGFQSLRETSFPNRCYTSGNGTAAVARHCVWKAIQTAANAEYGGTTDWTAPEAQYLSSGTPAPDPAASATGQVVPDVAGQTLDAAKQALAAVGYDAVEGDAVPGTAGTVVSTEPAAGTTAPAGTQVVLHPGSG